MLSSVLVTALIGFKGCLAADEETYRRSNAVRDAFEHAWAGYIRCGSGKDTVDAIQCLGVNNKGSWGVTNIDSIGTALVMNLTEIANAQIAIAVSVDFSKLGPGDENEGLVSSFDSTAAYLGGLLSVHDLLLNGYGDAIPGHETKAQQLLIQARMLGETLNPAWNTLSNFPGQFLNLSATPSTIYNGPDVGDHNSAAGIGTLQLEYARLSNLTGIASFVDRAVVAARKLFTPTPESSISASYAGLLGRQFDINTGEMTSDVGGWIGGIIGCNEHVQTVNAELICTDYEYLLKLYIYDPSKYQDFLAQFRLVASSTMKHLISNPLGFPNTTYVASHVGRQATYNAEHLSCSTGGTLLQASKFLTDNSLATLGLNLVDGCRFVATHTAKGVPPEAYAWLDNIDPVPSLEPTDQQNEYVKTHGYWTPQDDDAIYNLRAEYIESLFHAWRVTKDGKYRDWAWDAFQAINASCRHENGFVPIRDVTSSEPRDDRELVDSDLSIMESYFLAKTLKYAYLIFQEDSVLPLDDWVFNTQGHPIRIEARDVERKMNAECFQYEWCTNYGWR